MSPKDKIKQNGITLDRFLRILANQEEYRGYVISVGKVSCTYQAVDEGGRAVSARPGSTKYPAQFYVVDIEMDESAYEEILIPRWNPSIKSSDFIKSIMKKDYKNRKIVTIDGLDFLLAHDQEIIVKTFDPFHDIIELQLPPTKHIKEDGEINTYPCLTSPRSIGTILYNGQETNSKGKFKFTSEEIISQKKLGDYAAYVLNNNVRPVVGYIEDPYKEVHTFKDVIGPWVRDYIVGQKITIAVSLDVSKFVGVSFSAEVNWLLAGKDASWAPYGTVSKGTLVSGSGGVSLGVNFSGNHFVEGKKTKSKDINRGMISGESISASTKVARWRGMDVNIQGTYSDSATPDGKQDGYWAGGGGGLSISLINGATPLMKKGDFQMIIQETSKTLHLSPSKGLDAFDKHVLGE